MNCSFEILMDYYRAIKFITIMVIATEIHAIF